MLAILVAIRDFLLAAALAWVGVSIERTHQTTNQDAQCAGQSCQAREQR
jgi:hypothetical protein